GSLCFLVGALPPYADAVGAVATNVTFVVGAVFFTGAASVQLGLSGRRPPRAGTHPADRWDWWAAAVQLVGTLCFNVSTTAALVAAVDAGGPGAGGRGAGGRRGARRGRAGGARGAGGAGRGGGSGAGRRGGRGRLRLGGRGGGGRVDAGGRGEACREVASCCGWRG